MWELFFSLPRLSPKGAGPEGLTAASERKSPLLGGCQGERPTPLLISTGCTRGVFPSCRWTSLSHHPGNLFPWARGTWNVLAVSYCLPRVHFTLWSILSPTARGASKPHFEQVRPKGRQTRKCGHRIWTQVSLVPRWTLSRVPHSSGEECARVLRREG